MPNRDYPTLRTVNALRAMVGMTALCLPYVLWGLQCYYDKGACPRPNISISDYYHYDALFRDLLVGALCSIGVFLVLYRGYNGFENILTNIGGISAIGVALFPVASQCSVSTTDIFHVISAVILFSILAVFCLFFFTKSNPEKKMTPRKKIRNSLYIICGVGIVSMMVAIGIYVWAYPACSAPRDNYLIFACETIALNLFGISWLTKAEMICPDRDKSKKWVRML